MWICVTYGQYNEKKRKLRGVKTDTTKFYDVLCFITDKFYWSMHKDLKYIETWLSPFSNRKSENSWSDKK